MWRLRGFIPDSAFVKCDLDLQSLKAKRPYCIPISSPQQHVSGYSLSVYLLPYCTCANSDVSSFSSLVFKFLLYRDRLYLSFDSQYFQVAAAQEVKKSVGDIAIAPVRPSVCPSVTLSPPKPLDEIQPNLVCELLT